MDKKKVILIPDLHGRTFWKKAVAEADSDTRIVFLVDYTDPYPFEEITPAEAYHNFVDVLDFARNRPHVELLLGNHDCGYLFGEKVCNCRADEERYEEIRQLMLDNRDLFKFCTVLDMGGLPYMVSHAGINRQWLEAHAREIIPDGGTDCKSLCKIINGYFLNGQRDERQTEMLAEVSRHRGGWDAYGSIVWADIHEFDDQQAHLPIDQIVGHTLQVFEEFDKDDYTLYYGGACVKRGPESKVCCIDTAEAYYIDGDGILCYMRNGKAVEE